MNRGRLVLLLAFASAAWLAAPGGPALAQCAMCKESLANSADGAALARGLDLAVLVLLVPPVAIFAGIFGVFYRYRNIQGGAGRPGEGGPPRP
jgi:hypothetical protein